MPSTLTASDPGRIERPEGRRGYLSSPLTVWAVMLTACVAAWLAIVVGVLALI